MQNTNTYDGNHYKRSVGGCKKMIEYLKTQRYVTIVEEKNPTAALVKAMNEAKTGNVTRAKNITELLEKLKS